MSSSALSPLSSGAITGTGIITLSGNRFGGGRFLADGTNSGTVLIYDGIDNTGILLFELSNKLSMTDYAPIICKEKSIYYNISGTGASFQPYEWIDTGGTETTWPR